MPYGYIERYYGKKFEVGHRVVFTEGKRRDGFVMEPVGDPQYVEVQFADGHVGNCHPDSLEPYTKQQEE